MVIKSLHIIKKIVILPVFVSSKRVLLDLVRSKKALEEEEAVGVEVEEQQQVKLEEQIVQVEVVEEAVVVVMVNLKVMKVHQWLHMRERMVGEVGNFPHFQVTMVEMHQ